MDKTINKSLKVLKVLWYSIVSSMIALIPILYFAIISKPIMPPPNHLEGMGPLFFGISIILCVLSYWQYTHFTSSHKLNSKYIRMSKFPEKFFKNREGNGPDKEVLNLLKRLNEQEKKTLYFSRFYIVPLMTSVTASYIITFAGICLGISTQSFFASIPFTLLGVFSCILAYPNQKLLLERAKE